MTTLSDDTDLPVWFWLPLSGRSCPLCRCKRVTTSHLWRPSIATFNHLQLRRLENRYGRTSSCFVKQSLNKGVRVQTKTGPNNRQSHRRDTDWKQPAKNLHQLFNKCTNEVNLGENNNLTGCREAPTNPQMSYLFPAAAQNYVTNSNSFFSHLQTTWEGSAEKKNIHIVSRETIMIHPRLCGSFGPHAAFIKDPHPDHCSTNLHVTRTARPHVHERSSTKKAEGKPCPAWLGML